MYKSIIILIGVLFVSSCETKPTLQKYYVKNLEFSNKLEVIVKEGVPKLIDTFVLFGRQPNVLDKICHYDSQILHDNFQIRLFLNNCCLHFHE